jgi:tellurite methyltransferase
VTVLRSIDGFHQDAIGDWVADLRCGHGQHVRHRPPFWERPWVLTAEGRDGKLGVELDCVLCDRFEMPAGHAPYKRTRELDEHSVPPGLLKDHSTARGVWGVIHVIAGRLRYIVEPPLAGEHVLDETHPGVVVAEVLHRVAPEGHVRFFVEFHRKE